MAAKNLEKQNIVTKALDGGTTPGEDDEKQIEAIESLNKNSADYRKQCFELASEMNFFRMPKETQESILLRENYEKSDFFKITLETKKLQFNFI